MFWKLITCDVDDGDRENGPGKSYEIDWVVCRAKNEGEAEKLLLVFIKYLNLPIPKNYSITRTTEEEYYEFLDYRLD